MSLKLTPYINNRKKRLEKLLDSTLTITQSPKQLLAAMRYSVLNGGKRIRPLLVYSAGETFGASLPALDIPAVAIELIHCYSLVHDDLPAMDNDDFRRGKPTCHKTFGEATAILAGSALYNKSFEILTTANAFTSETRMEMIATIASTCGTKGLIGGQAMEFELLNNKPTQTQLNKICALKTGALINCAIKFGAIIAKVSAKKFALLDKFGQQLGLAFQIQDDIFDKTLAYGLKTANQQLQTLQQQIQQFLCTLKIEQSSLAELTTYIMNRNH